MQKLMGQLLKKRDQKGFTLIELLVVIAIVGTLMAIGVSNYTTYRTKGADAAADYLTLSMAEAADQGAIGPLAPATGTPTGFILPPNVTAGGAGISITAAGVISGTATFADTSGGEKLYTIDVDGVVEETDQP